MFEEGLEMFENIFDFWTNLIKLLKAGKRKADEGPRIAPYEDPTVPYGRYLPDDLG